MKNKKLTSVALILSMLVMLFALPKDVAAATNNDVTVSYCTHVQNVGWQDFVSNGAMSGTEGQSLRLEGMKVTVSGQGLGVRYKTHVQNDGWQDWVYDGAMSGTEGRSLRLEGMEIELTGSNAANYDIYYRVHVQNIGWMDWVKNGQMAGTEGQSLRLEGMEIKVVPAGTSPTFVTYNTHVENIGWQSDVTDGLMAGTTGQSLRLEGIHITSNIPGVGIKYKTHVQNIGWQDWVYDGAMSGTEGQALRLEGIQIALTGSNAGNYDVWYRTHVQNFGWTGWARNGASCGSAGYSYRLEGIEILILPVGSAAPGSTANCFYETSPAPVAPSNPDPAPSAPAVSAPVDIDASARANGYEIIDIDMGNGQTQRIYGYYVDMSELDNMINNYRVNTLGLQPYLTSGVPQDAIDYFKIRAAEVTVSWSHSRPGGNRTSASVYGENLSSGTDPAQCYNGLYNSNGHRRLWTDTAQDYIYSVGFVRMEYNSSTNQWSEGMHATINGFVWV